MTSEKMCCVPHCDSRQEILHKFPNPDKEPDRFRTWIYNIGGDILSLENAIIFKRRRVCHLHFESDFHTRSKMLSPNAVPTLHLSVLKRRPLADLTNPTASSSGRATEADVVICQTTSSGGAAADANISTLPPTNIEVKPMQQKVESKRPSTSSARNFNKKTATNEKALKNEILKLKNENDSFKQRLKKAKKLSTNSAFQTTLKKFKTLAAIFTVMQFREINKPKMGRRFTKEEKIMALSMYKVGPKAYRWLSKIFVLPSPVTLSRMVSRANLKPGINENIFVQLSKRVKRMKTDDKLCTLIFDEMALSPHFEYNQKKDKISGYVNYNGKATQKIADHVLVFMIRGVLKNYKQPISYSFCSGSTPKVILAKQIKKNIKKLHSIGFTVLATVCDQGTSNMSAINYLIEETRRNYLRKNVSLRTSTFEVDGKQIIPLYDVPHLLKGIRNNLLTKNLKVTIGGEEKIVKWEHITQLYENNPTYKGLKIIKNLTEYHCDKNKILKMKVKYASQLFSQTVGKTMGYLAENGLLPEETKNTADFIIFMDDLFDSLNGSQKNSTNRSGKDLLRNVTPKSRHSDIWLEAKRVLKSMKFVTMKGSSGTVPSINNWVKTIENMELLRDKLFYDYKIKSFWCRHLNQDPLENFFGSIRSHGFRNNSPSCAAFEAAFASLLVTNMSSNYSRGSNCEEDFCTMFESFDELFFKTHSRTSPVSEVDYSDVINEDIICCFETKKKNPRIIAQLEYVTGYLLRKSKHIFKNCETCNGCLYTKDPGTNKYLKHREYYKNKHLLHYPSEELTRYFSDIQDTLHHILRQIVMGFVEKNVRLPGNYFELIRIRIEAVRNIKKCEFVATVSS
ncbi:unnamed protein product [Colias eurytheme]|nr:unnamed protein product [Colias eurytheme]